MEQYQYIDRLAIKPTAIKDDYKVILFTTMIPKYAYKDAIVDCVVNQIELFEMILQPLGYHVQLEISEHPR